MKNSGVSSLQRQVGRVYRRIALQKMLNILVWFWIGAIALAALWFLVEPWAVPQHSDSLRWTVALGLLGAATMLGVALGIYLAPPKILAALSLDSKFGLKERVTTSLTLAPEQESSSAGLALLEDVNKQVSKLDVASRFPVRVSWNAALVPVCAVLLALIALFYEPGKSNRASASTAASTVDTPQNIAEIHQKMNDLKKKVAENSSKDKEKSEDLKQLEAELEKIANKPAENKEQIHERLKEMTGLEESMKGKERELAEKTQALKQQLKQLEQTADKNSEGPAKDLEKALSEGKLDKAKEAAERLAKRMRANELTPKEKEQLQKQLQEMQKKLERMASQKDKEEALKKAGLDPETLKREMDKLKKDGEKLKELQELAKQLEKAQKGMKQNDMQEAADGISMAGKKMEKMNADEGDLGDLRDQLKSLQDAKDSAGEADELRAQDPQDQELQEDTENAGNPGAGRRPLGKKKPFKSFDAKARPEFDPKGKKIFDGYAPGQSFKKRTGVEIAGEIKQASQEAPEAIEQQRIPRAAQDMAKEYFQRMREQAERDLKTDKK